MKKAIVLLLALAILGGCDSKPAVTRDDQPAAKAGDAGVSERKSLAHTRTTIVPLAAGQPGSGK